MEEFMERGDVRSAWLKRALTVFKAELDCISDGAHPDELSVALLRLHADAETILSNFESYNVEQG